MFRLRRFYYKDESITMSIVFFNGPSYNELYRVESFRTLQFHVANCRSRKRIISVCDVNNHACSSRKLVYFLLINQSERTDGQCTYNGKILYVHGRIVMRTE